MDTQKIDSRYPIGRFQRPQSIAPADRADAIAVLAELPGQLRSAVSGLRDEQLDTPYRDGGWTVRQVVHHVADSHMNALVRVKLALTEDWPTIKPYDEAAWAKLGDMTMPIDPSLDLVESLHARWVKLLQSLDEPQWKRGFDHPESGRQTIEQVTMLYAWHSRHHTAHITRLRERKGW